jgi:hypothetical protein
MSERPILFSSPMVRAILEGRKTQTRRIVRPSRRVDKLDDDCPLARCPYGVVGDRLWVRETWQSGGRHAGAPAVYYRADADLEYGPHGGWRPSIFMPRRLSRITLLLESVRVERLQAITTPDILAEGIRYPVSVKGCPPGKCVPLLRVACDYPPGQYREEGDELTHEALLRAHFAAAWDTLNAKRGFGWASNPWVWALTFSVVRP